jgi:hypothetical protein
MQFVRSHKLYKSYTFYIALKIYMEGNNTLLLWFRLLVYVIVVKKK